MAEQVTDALLEKVLKGSEQMTEAKALALGGEFYQRGRFKEAANVCRQIIQHNPNVADAHNILGVSLCGLGKTKEGIASIKRAIKLAPKVASFHANLGEIYRTSGKLADGIIALNEAIRLNPRNAQAHNNLGIIRYERKEYDEAVACYRQALAINPKFAEALNNLGNSLRMIADVDGALAAYEEALALREVYPEAYNNLGTLLREQRKVDQAQHALRKAIAQNPRYTDAYNNLANILFAEKEEVEALRLMAEVLKYAPRNPKSLLITARIQTRRGNYPAAEQACAMVLHDDPNSAEAMTVLGQLMHETDRFDEAVALLERAVAIDPDSADAHNFFGVALKSVGRLDEARDQILEALRLNDRMYGAYANLNDLVDFSTNPELFARIKSLVEEAEDSEADYLLPMHYAYAKALDDSGKPEDALEHYILGGQMKRHQLNYVEADTFSFFDNIKQAFTAETFTQRKFAGCPDDRLVFIVGMPRSGSTLVEQIVSSHPDIYGAGEVKYLTRALHQLRDRFPSLSRYPAVVEELNQAQYQMFADRYVEEIARSAGGARRITDKLLTNYFYVGMIHLLFPNARIINTQRDPIDTCLSAFTKLFKDDMPHSYDLTDLGRYYRQYQSLIDHWHQVLPAGVMMTVQYEDVIADTEKEARALIDFIGLDWNDACLEFYNSSRPVKTASVAQVRKPIYKTAVERWRKYGDGLKPLIDTLNG